MRFTEFITTVTRPLKFQIKAQDYEFLGDNTRLLLKVKEEVFIILNTGVTKRGSFDNCSEESFYIDGDEVPLRAIIFIGKLG